MTKKEHTIKVITTTQHKDFSTFSRNMVDYPHVAIKEVSTNKLVGGEVVKGIPLEKIVHATGKHKYTTHKISLLVVKDELEGTIVTTTNSDFVYLSNQRACLSDEALLYLVHLSGHPKNMFLFIVFYLINTETLEFKTDSSIKYKYVEFCKATGCRPPVIVTINDAIKRLSEIGLILNVKKNLYMINPIVLGYSYDINRSKAITLYANKLKERGKAIEDWLLPKIELIKNKQKK